MSVKISRGVVTADTVNTTVLSVKNISVTGDATVAGRLSVNGADVIKAIGDQSTSLQEHAQNTTVHLTAAEHEKFNQIAQIFADVAADAPTYPTTVVPSTAIPVNYFNEYYKAVAQPNYPLAAAPRRVYGSRVPYAYKDASGAVANVAPTISAAGNFFANNMTAKLWSNANLNHACSTDTVLGVDDYVGKEWVFYWQYGNYIKDEYGVKHITAIRGVTGGTVATPSGTFNIPAFDQTQNIAAFGPIFWFAVKTEKFQQADGTWLTADGTENGSPISQLWVISDSPWSTIVSDGITYEGLDADTIAELEAHGLTEEDFHVWPSCQVWDASTNSFVLRPYWCHSAFCGGYDSTSTQGLVSKLNAPLRNNLSYNNIIAFGNQAAVNPGKACVNAFGMLFDIVKNANKNSQQIHMGMSQNNQNAVKAAVAITTPSYLFPISSQGVFDVGGTVCLSGYNSAGSAAIIGNAQAFGYTTTNNTQYVRIAEIAKYDLTDPTAELKSDSGQLCLRIDPANNTAFPVKPFVVVTTKADQDALGSDVQYCAYACQGFSLGGETMNGGVSGTGVLGMHDGSVTSLSNGKHPYRVQGTEYMPGGYICAGDTVAVKGDGSTALTIDGVSVTPTTSQMVILTCPDGKARLNSTSNTLSPWITAGYVPSGVVDGTVSDKFIYNETISWNGVAYPVLAGSTSDQEGHGDKIWISTNEAKEFLSGGRLDGGTVAGSAYLYLNGGLGNATWGICARD